jgi:hypothetical protein
VFFWPQLEVGFDYKTEHSPLDLVAALTQRPEQQQQQPAEPVCIQLFALLVFFF